MSTSPEQKLNRFLNKRALLLPPKKPKKEECCDRGCVPCIFDYYTTSLIEWQTYLENEKTKFSSEERATLNSLVTNYLNSI